VRAGDFEVVRGLSDRTARLAGRAELSDLRWEGGAWRAELEAEMTLEGSPVVLTPEGEDSWRVDPRLLVDGMQTRPDRTAELLNARATVDVLGHDTAVNWFAPGDLRPELVPIDAQPDARRLVLRGSVRFDAATLAGGRPLAPDDWLVRVRIFAFGHNVMTRLRALPGQLPVLRPVIAGSPPVVVVASFGRRDDHLSFQVRPAGRASLGGVLAGAATEVRLGSELEVDLRLDIAGEVGPLPLRVELRATERAPVHLEGTIVSSASGAVLRIPVAAARTLLASSGRFRVVVPSRPPARVGVWVVVADGRITDAGLTSRRSEPERLPARRAVRAGVRRLGAAIKRPGQGG
jgi:hypothetical protein